MLGTQMFNICNQDEHDPPKMLTIANQPDVRIKQFISVTRFSSKETKSRLFVIPCAVADIKYNMPGTPMVEKYIQGLNIQAFSMHFKQSFNDQPTIACSPH